MEINAFSDPGTYIGFSALQYDQFKFGANRAKEANIFFTKYAVSLDNNLRNLSITTQNPNKERLLKF